MNQTHNTSMLSVGDVATRLAVSAYTVYELVKAGTIKATRVGNQYRIDPSDLDAYIAANSNQPTPEARQ